MEQRPAAVAALDGAQVVGDLGLDRAERRRVDLAQEMLQEDVFRRDGGVGFQLEQPVAVGALLGFQGRAHLAEDRKSTRLNSSTNAHLVCRLLLEKKKTIPHTQENNT